MNGDLSLSGSLGGLRIANPDDESSMASSSAASLPAGGKIESDAGSSGERSTSTVADSRHEPPLAEEPIGASTSQSHISAAQKFYDASRQQQSSGSRQPNKTNASAIEHEGPLRTDPDGGARQRPVSAIYEQSNTSNTSQASYRDGGRFAGEMMAQQASLARSSSRSASHPMANGYPERQASQRNRSQQQHPSQYNTPNGAIPPRRTSRRLPMHQADPNRANQAVRSPYSIEGGPLPSSEEWKDRGAAVSMRQELDQDGKTVQRIVKKGVNDFDFGSTLGEGSYSTVMRATDRQTGKDYAIKVLDKRHIIKEKKVKYVNIEKDTLNRLTDHPGVVKLYYTFQDERSLYFVLDLAAGGELLGVLKKTGTFDIECTRFYAAQILDSIAYMHSQGIIHRDLKPENVLLDSNMHTKIADFGTAKILSAKSESGKDAGNPTDGQETGPERALSFVGTAEYVSPELLRDKSACKASDLWAFGCIVFQLLAGRPPFKASNEYQTFQKIVALDYQFPEGFPPVAKDLVQRLLVLDPARRLPVEHIKSHPFFEGMHWGRGLWKMRPPQLKPYVPPAREPIRLNGANANTSAMTPRSQVTSPAHAGAPAPRPYLRAVTELPPPSQLDIDWSPVLTRPNERILKMGNLIVTILPLPPSPQQSSSADTSKRFSRFFGGGTTKKKQRLVMVTSTARIVVVAAGGDEKKPKLELPLMHAGVVCKDFVDARGLTVLCVETKDKQILFEDPRSNTSDPEGSRYYTREWIEKIEWAKELSMSQSVNNSFSADTDYGSAVPSPNSVAGSEPQLDQSAHRAVLRRDGDNESLRSRKNRFSKRHSKSGLAAVF